MSLFKTKFNLYKSGINTYLHFKYGFFTFFFRFIGFAVIEFLTYGFIIKTYANNSLALKEVLVVYSIVAVLFRMQQGVGGEFIAARDRGEYIFNSVSPMSFFDWVVITSVVNFFYSFFTYISMLIAAIVFFEINIFISLKIIIICYFLTALFGICVGVVAASVVLANGYFADMLAWGIPGVLFIFSGAFIPLRVLPRWMQYIANIMPTSSLYDFLRDFIKNKMLLNVIL